MEIELPDPASIWKELGEFRSVIDSYAREQSFFADRLKKTHVEFCLDHKNKLDTIDQQRKKARHDVENLENEKRREAEELARMKKKVATLDREASELPSKVELHKAQTDKQELKATKMREVVQKKDREARASVQVEREELEVYQNALGMTIHKNGEDQLSFRFRCIDVNDPTAEFSFTVSTSSGSLDQSAVFELVSCLPPLESVATIINAFNQSQHPEKLSTLVRLVRREFYNAVRTN